MQACAADTTRWMQGAASQVDDASMFITEALKSSTTPTVFTSYMLGFDEPGAGSDDVHWGVAERFNLEAYLDALQVCCCVVLPTDGTFVFPYGMGMHTHQSTRRKHVVFAVHVANVWFLTAVTTACAKKTGAAASVERRRREPARAVSPD